MTSSNSSWDSLRIPHVCKITSLFEPELYMAQAQEKLETCRLGIWASSDLTFNQSSGIKYNRRQSCRLRNALGVTTGWWFQSMIVRTSLNRMMTRSCFNMHLDFHEMACLSTIRVAPTHHRIIYNPTG